MILERQIQRFIQMKMNCHLQNELKQTTTEVPQSWSLIQNLMYPLHVHLILSTQSHVSRPLAMTYATLIPSETAIGTMLTKTTQTQDEPPVNLSTSHTAETTVPHIIPPTSHNNSSINQDAKQINYTKCMQDIAIFLLRSAIALIFLILTVINGATCYRFGKEFVPLLPLGILQGLYFYVILKHKDKKYIAIFIVRG